MEPKITTGIKHLQENFEDFFETSLCGFIIADIKGTIIRANRKLAEWVGTPTDELKGKRFSDLLAVSGKIYYETHLWPLLRMQGFFDEVVLELSNNAGQKSRVMVNALERRKEDGQPAFIRYTILKASDRLQYEQNLQQAKTLAEKELIKQTEIVALREQLIAVLGHDLRNPLSAISMAIELLPPSVAEEDVALVAMLKRSSSRMTELVKNIVDFARTRLGEGIILNRQDVVLEPVLQQVVAELRLIHPKREIVTLFKIAEPVNCDSNRIAQLLSNLLANALTHGADDTPVYIHALHDNGNFELSVINNGEPIPAGLHERLFAPFTREASRPSQNGLGLGLYISAEIAKAHNGMLSMTSTVEETRFMFRMSA